MIERVRGTVGAIAAGALFGAVAAFAALCPAGAATAGDEVFRAVARMDAVRAPAYVSYEVVVRAHGAQYYVTRDPTSGKAEFGFSVGRALGDTDHRWNVVVRTADETTSVALPGAYAVTAFPVLNATWGGIDAWMRFGIRGRDARPADRRPAAAATTPAVPTIAVVHALSAPAYAVSGGGSSTCDGGAPARRFFLRARYDATRHPATDITIDDATRTICTIRFQLQRNEIVSGNAYVELHLQPLHGVFIVKRGEIAFDPNPRLGARRIRLFIDYVGVTFPFVAPPGAFQASPHA